MEGGKADAISGCNLHSDCVISIDLHAVLETAVLSGKTESLMVCGLGTQELVYQFHDL